MKVDKLNIGGSPTLSPGFGEGWECCPATRLLISKISASAAPLLHSQHPYSEYG